MDKMRMESMDMTTINMEKISAMFPSCITEVLDEEKSTKENKVYKHAVDFEKLKSLLGADVAEGNEAYEFTWVGKKAAIKEAGTPVRMTLRPCKEESKNWDTTQNLYIEGDNLDVLKMLQESYLGKVKMIYIDPPYNTGNDFIYNDSFEMDKEEYAEGTGSVDEDNNKNFKQNNDSNPRFHSDWCSMIYPRLALARNLLTDDGVIFISIDDNENAQLRKICDEIFGEENFIGCAGRITKKANNQGDFFAPNFDYLLTFSKNKNSCSKFFGGMNTDAYNFTEEEGERKGEKYQLVRLYMTSLDPLRGCINQRYYIKCPDGSYIIPPGENFPEKTEDAAHIAPKNGNDKVWRWSYQSYLEKKDSIVIKKGKSSNVVGVNGAETHWNAFTKTYLNDVIKNSSAIPNSFIEDQINQKATHELNELKIPFSFPKPSSLIHYLISICKADKDSIILDFFSGSASAAHAVIQANVEDGGNRKFIMVQLPENCDKDSDAFKAGYKNICEIGKERIRRAGDKILAEWKEKKAKEDESLIKSEKVMTEPDTGFRVFKADSTNMKDVYYTPAQYSQDLLKGLESNIKEDRTDMDLLYACLLDWGLELSLPYSSEQIEGCTVHTVNNGDLIACFAEKVPENVIRTIAERKSVRVVFRDSSFADTPTKINVTEIFKTVSPNTTMKVM